MIVQASLRLSTKIMAAAEACGYYYYLCSYYHLSEAEHAFDGRGEGQGQ